jgi:hypothetical protein
VDHAAIKRLIEKRRVATIELLTEADFQDLEPLLLLLKRLRPIEEVSTALMERMAITPLSEFNARKALYFRHFVVRIQ